MVYCRWLLETLPERCPQTGARRTKYILSSEKWQVGLVLTEHGVLALRSRMRRLLPMVLLGRDRAISLPHLLYHFLRRRVVQIVTGGSPCSWLCYRKA